MSNIKERLVWALRYCLGRIRIYFGRCPLCNSDAPDLYDCECCNFYSSASGDLFPPKLETKNEWWNMYKSVIDCQLKLSVSIKESKNRRLKIYAKRIYEGICGKGGVMKYWHKLMHKFNWYDGRVVSKLNDDGDVMIGFQCDKCGLIDDWHVVRLDKQIDLEIENRMAARPGRNG